jgi:FlaA1/EpsC-like NDP-sugar epimerase
VIETFLEQLAAGQPLTITDAAMTRYWISMPEAVDLVLAAVSPGAAGATLLLDAGEAVSVLDMAERLRGLIGAPAGRADVVYLGSRPGERLAEELASRGERLVPGPTPGLLRVERLDDDAALGQVRAHVGDLAAALAADDPSLGGRLMALARKLK